MYSKIYKSNNTISTRKLGFQNIFRGREGQKERREKKERRTYRHYKRRIGRKESENQSERERERASWGVRTCAVLGDTP